MASNFFFVGKANARIDELEKILADRDASLKAAQDRITELESKADTGSDQLKADLATAKQTIGTLESQAKANADEIAKLKTDLGAAKTEAESAKSAASHKAHEITASQGQPPLTIKPEGAPANNKTTASTNLSGLERAIALHKADYATNK